MRFFLILFLCEIFSRNIRKCCFLRPMICCKYNEMVKNAEKWGFLVIFIKTEWGMERIFTFLPLWGSIKKVTGYRKDPKGG